MTFLGAQYLGLALSEAAWVSQHHAIDHGIGHMVLGLQAQHYRANWLNLGLLLRA
jgi:hypothetical protein